MVLLNRKVRRKEGRLWDEGGLKVVSVYMLGIFGIPVDLQQAGTGDTRK